MTEETGYSEVRTFADGDIIFEQDQRAAEAYLVRRGRVKIIRDGKEVATIEPRGLFGELAIISDMPRLMTAVSVGETICHAITRADFSALLASLDAESAEMVRALVYYVEDVNRDDYEPTDPNFQFEEKMVREIIAEYQDERALERLEVFLAHLCRGLLAYAKQCLTKRGIVS